MKEVNGGSSEPPWAPPAYGPVYSVSKHIRVLQIVNFSNLSNAEIAAIHNCKHQVSAIHIFIHSIELVDTQIQPWMVFSSTEEEFGSTWCRRLQTLRNMYDSILGFRLATVGPYLLLKIEETSDSNYCNLYLWSGDSHNWKPCQHCSHWCTITQQLLQLHSWSHDMQHAWPWGLNHNQFKGCSKYEVDFSLGYIMYLPNIIQVICLYLIKVGSLQPDVILFYDCWYYHRKRMQKQQLPNKWIGHFKSLPQL